MDTPARRQYLELKQQHPNRLLLFQMGDFFEAFDEDARLLAAALNITLTSREFGKAGRVPMAGIPVHALSSYLRRLVQRGLHVAICEQMGEPGHGLVDRAVTRVVTPGTVVEPALLAAKQNNYLAALALADAGRARRSPPPPSPPASQGQGSSLLPAERTRARAGDPMAGLAYVDVTTGEFAATEFCGAEWHAELGAELARLGPAECVVADRDALPLQLPGHATAGERWWFEPDAAAELLKRQFGVMSLAGFGLEGQPLATAAAGAILAYVEQTSPPLLGLITGVQTYSVGTYVTLDSYTRRSLELTRPASAGRGPAAPAATLLEVLDVTQTPMGGRLLRRWLTQPLAEPEAIERRHDAVGALKERPVELAALRDALARCADIERLAGRARQGTATPRELLLLAESLAAVPSARETALRLAAPDLAGSLLAECARQLDDCRSVAEVIERAVAPERDDRLIRPGYDQELDSIQEAAREARAWLAALETAERQRTGIKSLKVGYNKVFGYYLELSRAALRSGGPPEGYIRRQTLVNAERFVTAELKERETRILNAEARATELERTLYEGVLRQIGDALPRLIATGVALATLDTLASLALVAARRGYVRPEMHAGTETDIRAGRHPVVEAALEPGAFVPNDCRLGGDEQVLVVTGPNMAGKSTYLRQVALIVLLAQMGSFVPAEAAKLGLVDRIFTRVGAHDDLASGTSTFMVEMLETAHILRHATARSLVVLDEIGRGTSTYDGLAIARAVVEHVHDHVGARTLFATHYHELTELASLLPRVRNLRVEVSEVDGELVFLRRVVPGGADRSYGVQVARLAGVPHSVVARAAALLTELERQSNGRRPPAPSVARPHPNGRAAVRVVRQLCLFPLATDPGPLAPIAESLASLDPANMTPLEALARLFELRDAARAALAKETAECHGQRSPR